ncbi:MAG: ATP-binding protein [Actinomycetota bacterium]
MTKAATSPSVDDWRRRLGGSCLVSWPMYAIGTPIAFVTFTWSEIALAPAGTPAVTLLATAGLVAVACAAVGAWMLLANATFLRHRAVHPVPFVPALIFLGSFGTLFAIVLVVGAPLVGAPPIENPAFTVAAMTVISAWWSSVLVLLLDARERITADRVVVLNAAVDQEIATIQQADLSRVLRDYLDTRVNDELQGVRDTLDQALIRVESDARIGGWTEVSEDLRIAARASVRQLSADLWSMAEAAYPRVTLRSMLPAIVRTQPLRPLAVAGLTVLVTVQSTTERLGWAVGLLATLVGALAVYVVLALANRVMRAWPRRHAVIFIATIVLISAGGMVTTAASGGEVTVIGSIFNLAVTAIILIATSAFGAVYRANTEMLGSLASRVSQESIANLSRQRELSAIARQAASVLHGQVQTRLIACAAAIDRAVAINDYALLTRTLEQARDILEQPLVVEPTPASLDDLLRAHRERWAGLVELDYEPSMSVDLDLATLQQVSLVVEEGIVNAFRHGEATHVRVSVSEDGRELRVSVVDDGAGPGSRVDPGTGSALLAHNTRDRWELSRVSGEGGARLDAVITR